MKKLCTFLAMAIMAASALGAGGSVGATRAWTSNYVASVVASIGEPAAVSNLVRDVVADMLNASVPALSGYEDDMTSTTNGKAVFYLAVSYHDSYVLERREYDVTISQTNTPPCFGCRVVSSAVDGIPVGTLYAVAADGLRVCNVGAAPTELEIYKTSDGWRLYGSGSGATYDSIYLYEAGRIRVGKWTGGTLRGTFTVEPFALTEEQAAACLGGEQSGFNSWAALATGRTSTVSITFSTPLDADESSGVQGGVYFSTKYVGPNLVDYEELWPTDDEHYWSPRWGLPPGAWEDPHNWLSFPLTGSIEYDDAGTTRSRDITITSLEMLKRLLGKYGQELIIPPPGNNYTYPVLKKYESFECQKFGHVWHQCVCTVCSATRDHDFQFEAPNECAKCQNKDTDRKRTDSGDWEVFELDRKCGLHDTQGIVEYHAGWHHVGQGEEASGWEEYYCSCQCGCFSPSGVALSHDLQPTGEPPEQHDETYHRVYSACSRCPHRAYKLELHTPDFNDESIQLLFYDKDQHWVVGKCSECEQQLYGLKDHNWGYYGDGEDKYCCCPCFFTLEGVEYDEDNLPLMHTTPVYRAMVNPYDPSRVCEGDPICERCRKKMEDAMMEFPPQHYFGYETDGNPDGKGNDSYHYCACGSQVEPHSDEFYDDDIRVCGPCGRSRDNDGRGGRLGNDSKTSKDPSKSDPTSPTDNPNGPYGPKGPFDPRGPWTPNPDDPGNPHGPDDPDDPDNPDNPEPPEPPFPPMPDFPDNPGGNSSVTIDPNVRINNWVRVTF